MELVVRGPRGGGVGYWFRSLLAQIPLGGRWNEFEDEDAPAVVARAASGTEYVRQRTRSEGQARRARDRLQSDLDRLGEAELALHRP